MFGYEWESPEEELKTLELVHYCLRKGYAKTAQASVYAPSGCKRSDPDPEKPDPRDIYKVARSPEFWIRKIMDLKSREDFLYFIRSIKEGLK
jgi:hypothetical protein